MSISRDGAAWTGERPGQRYDAQPWRYRDAKVRVKEVLYSSDRLRVAQGAEITVRLYGDATPTGSRVGGAVSGMRMNEISGPVTANTDVLFVLERGPWYTEDGDTEVVRLVSHYQGNWTLKDGRAESAEPRRSAPAAALIEKIKNERSAGRTGSQDGRVNPFGDEQRPR